MNRASLIGFGLLVVSIRVSALDIVCPEKIVTSQQLIESKIGWDQFVRPVDGKEPRWSPIAGISLYSGHPSEIAELVPDNGEDVWTFGASAPPEQPTYMACIYFNTRVQLIKSLPLNIKKCTKNKKERGTLRCELFKP